ncbi:hypothetical protein DYB31_016259 [Aphanomyces astaci]|uniref:Retrovirus-related Pol polyprotein from transposon TNT 1-94-like beta-barrel domain-containing protein n=1 Tax=Aphanomyces astaci TaxID=112090 RepID=A0A397EWY9_APHAT|nr:hypothetical protein DYB31_016259 [Aphanomyces astaci]
MSPSMSSNKSPVVLLNEDNWNSRGDESTIAMETRIRSDDEMSYGLLIESIDTSQDQYIERAKSAIEAYTALSDHHELKTKVDRLALLSDFYGMNWNMKEEPLPENDHGHQASYAREEYLFTANDTTYSSPVVTAMSVLDSLHQVIVDLGASSHTTGDAANLQNMTDYNLSITIANGTRTVATKKATMSITTSLGAALRLTDVLCVDGMPSTLLSIPVLMECNARCGVTFTKGQCGITFDGKPIARVTLHPTQRVYLLARGHGGDQAGWTQESQQAPHAPTLSKSELWHRRIGHLPIEAIKQCGVLGLGPPSTFPRTNTACECCVVSKMAKTPTPKTHNRKFKPGECWISDTKGPMRTQSEENFLDLLPWSKTQTANKTKIFRSDGGSEFTSTTFNNELNNNELKRG